MLSIIGEQVADPGSAQIRPWKTTTLTFNWEPGNEEESCATVYEAGEGYLSIQVYLLGERMRTR